jgi:hypothetical protein
MSDAAAAKVDYTCNPNANDNQCKNVSGEGSCCFWAKLLELGTDPETTKTA